MKNDAKSNVLFDILLIILSLSCIPLIVLILKLKVISGMFGTFVVFGITLVSAMAFTTGMKKLNGEFGTMQTILYLSMILFGFFVTAIFYVFVYMLPVVI